MGVTCSVLVLLGAASTLALGIVLVRSVPKALWRTAAGAMLLLLGVAGMALALAGLDGCKLASQREKLYTCGSLLSQLSKCVSMYEDKNDGSTRPNLQALSSPAEPWVLHRVTHCPLGDSGVGFLFPQPDYEYCYCPSRNGQTPDVPIVWDSHTHKLEHFVLRFLNRQYRNVGFADTHVETWDERDFRSRMTKTASAMADALKSKDCSVRKTAARLLGSIGDPRFVDPLITALSDENDSVQLAAIWALKEIRDLRAVGPLIAALEDKNRRIQLSAEMALYTITGEDFGRDRELWRRWWGTNKERLVEGK